MIGKKVLLVDDDIDSLRLNRIIFINAGAQVVTANDGLEGISKLHSHRPDLVILDVMMPGGSGFEVCKQIRKISNVPVIMLTARSFAIPKEQQEELQISNCLSKPFSPRELLCNIEDVLYQREMAAQHN